ncbi:MAG TPA: hypothetical protein VHS80_10680, partial [Chthoniobacterales bacterium]|nr:hypothetical protein [Chthoniobacterales bacterium]
MLDFALVAGFLSATGFLVSVTAAWFSESRAKTKEVRIALGRAVPSASAKVWNQSANGMQAAFQLVPYIGYVFNSDCNFPARATGFLE